MEIGRPQHAGHGDREPDQQEAEEDLEEEPKNEFFNFQLLSIRLNFKSGLSVRIVHSGSPSWTTTAPQLNNQTVLFKTYPQFHKLIPKSFNGLAEAIARTF